MKLPLVHQNYADLQIENAKAEFLANDRRWAATYINATEKALALSPDHADALRLADTQQFVNKNYAVAVGVWEKPPTVAPDNFNHAHEQATTLVEARALRDGKDPSAALTAAGVGTRGSPAAAPISTGAHSREQAGLVRHSHAKLSSMGVADAMSPEFKLSSVSRVVIVARIFRTGDARAQTGDFVGASPAIAIGADGVSVLINKVP